MLKNLVLALAILVVVTSAAQAKIIHVPGDYPTIQKGIDAAQNGDTVLVANGTYTGTGNKNLDFKGKSITVQSENGAELTTIDCQGDGRGFYFHSGEGENSVISGLTIVNGFDSEIIGGGGIYCYFSSPAITDCIITGNMSAHNAGGGIYCDRSSPTIVNCIITGNTAGYRGGAIRCIQSVAPIITNCIISNNTAYLGAGIECYRSSPNITNCTIVGNKAGSVGGAVYCYDSFSIISNCILWGDSPNELYVESGSPVVKYSDIQGGWPGVGNINADPLFVDPDNSDYHHVFLSYYGNYRSRHYSFSSANNDCQKQKTLKIFLAGHKNTRIFGGFGLAF